MPGATVPLGFPYPVPGDPIAAEQVQALAEAVDDAYVSTLASAAGVASPPAAAVSGTTASIVTGAGTPVQFNTVLFDSDGMANLVADPFSLTCQTAGVYAVSASAAFTPNVTGFRQIELQKNGVIVGRWASAAVSSLGVGVSQNASNLVSLVVGDKLGLSVGHTAGVSLTVFGLNLAAVRISA